MRFSEWGIEPDSIHTGLYKNKLHPPSPYGSDGPLNAAPAPSNPKIPQRIRKIQDEIPTKHIRKIVLDIEFVNGPDERRLLIKNVDHHEFDLSTVSIQEFVPDSGIPKDGIGVEIRAQAKIFCIPQARFKYESLPWHQIETD